MSSQIENYSHLVEIDEDRRRITIYRVRSKDGWKQLYTCIDLPEKKASEDKSGFHKFSQLLGENLLIDSPTARKILGL